MTLNVLGVLVKWEVEMFKLVYKSRQRKYIVFKKLGRMFQTEGIQALDLGTAAICLF